MGGMSSEPMEMAVKKQKFTSDAELNTLESKKPTTQSVAATLQVHPSITKEKERLKKILSKLEYKVPDSSGVIRLNSDGSFKEYGSYDEENGGGEWNSVTTDINFSSIKNDYQKVKKIHDTNIKLNDLINSKLVDNINLLVNKYGSLKELKKALEPYSFEQIGSTASLDYDLVGFIQKRLSFNKIDGITKAIEELLKESQPTPVVELQPVQPVKIESANGATFTIQLDEDDDYSVTTAEEIEKSVSLQDKVNTLIEEGKATKFCK